VPALVATAVAILTITSCSGSDDGATAGDTAPPSAVAETDVAAPPRGETTDGTASSTGSSTKPTIDSSADASAEDAADAIADDTAPGPASNTPDGDGADGIEVAIDLRADDGFCAAAATPLADGTVVQGVHVYRLRCTDDRVQTDNSVPVDPTHDNYLGYFDLTSTGIALDGDWELEFRPHVDAASTQGGVEIVLGGDFDPTTMTITGYGVFASGTSSSTSSQHIQRYAASQTSTNLTDNTFPFTGNEANTEVWTLRHHAGGLVELLIDGVVEDGFDDSADDQTTTSGAALRVRLESHNGPSGPEVSVAGIVVRDHLTG
jgi:hypothetical protein